MAFLGLKRTIGASVSKQSVVKRLRRQLLNLLNRALARDLGRPVYAVDLRNHGDSPHHPTHNYMSMADDIEGFIGEHKIHKPTLIGHSM